MRGDPLDRTVSIKRGVKQGVLSLILFKTYAEHVNKMSIELGVKIGDSLIRTPYADDAVLNSSSQEYLQKSNYVFPAGKELRH